MNQHVTPKTDGMPGLRGQHIVSLDHPLVIFWSYAQYVIVALAGTSEEQKGGENSLKRTF
jgi:hypothetical protein